MSAIVSTIDGIPYGFCDGHIERYDADSGALRLIFSFWNNERGLFTFNGFVGMCDNCALGVDVSAFLDSTDSTLLATFARRLFSEAPEPVPWRSFRFLDLDDSVMLEVVAESFSFQLLV